MARSDLTCIEPSEVWTRYKADFVADLSGGAASRVLLADQPHERHGVYTATFDDVEVFGHHHLHAFVRQNNQFDCQDIGGYNRRLDYHVAHHPGRTLAMPQITRDGERYSIDRGRLRDVDTKHIAEPTLFATPIEPLNWGMWLLQAIPTAAMFVEQKSADRMLVYVGRQWQRALLNTMGVEDARIEHQELGATYHCSTLTVRQYSHVDLVPTPNDRTLFQRLGRTLAPDANVNAGRRIFLSRRTTTRLADGKYRALVNEDQVIAAMSDLGFEIHEPETLSLPDQIRLFREASVVVGLGGAALFNVVFCRPGTQVVSIESSTAFVHGHATLFASLGHRFAIVFGQQDITDPTDIHKRWSLDVARLVSTISAL